ncbi:hypothetical protein B0H17DRAFT_1246146 [Mycena rosella]|uniref:Ricin B lectin domain-containing protein n=1 Tax=Mycena rosella TaxID=1033263 RepID=A0AAD7CYZ0_MYCRO|nr:hypothetical protein B0H17DRAFT_1246146 [Mycena rosella]
MLQYFALLILSPAAVGNAVPPSSGFFRILDFENRSVDLHNRSPADFDPIQTYNTSIGEGAQKWLFTPTGAPNQFRISNAVSGTFASYTTAPIGGDPNRCQVCAHPNLATLWNITANGAGFKIAESNSGLVMCAWQFQPTLPLPTSPLTLEAFDPTQTRQLFDHDHPNPMFNTWSI